MSNSLLFDLAQIFVSQVGPEWGLDYTEDSIKRVDQLVSASVEPGSAVQETFVLSIGAYLGETVCRTLGGDWHLNQEEIADSSVVVNGCEMWPFRRVRQRLYYGTERPLYAWFEMAKSAKSEEIQKLLTGQEQATMIRPTGRDPLVIQVKKLHRTGDDNERND